MKVPIQMRMKIDLFFHRFICRYWEWRLPKDLNEYVKAWNDIDRKRDKSLSARDFRFWLYLRKVGTVYNSKFWSSIYED